MQDDHTQLLSLKRSCYFSNLQSFYRGCNSLYEVAQHHFFNLSCSLSNNPGIGIFLYQLGKIRTAFQLSIKLLGFFPDGSLITACKAKKKLTERNVFRLGEFVLMFFVIFFEFLSIRLPINFRLDLTLKHAVAGYLFSPGFP